VAETVARHADHALLFVNKSTVPVGTGRNCEERIATILRERGCDFTIPVISNPEFLREGLAVADTMAPDRIIVGINNEPTTYHLQPTTFMEELYRPLTRVGRPLVFMNRESAEIVKYAANAFLATKISFINMLTEFCEQTGASIRDVALGLGLDERIGPRFLHAGIGYGGSCFPKDVKALLATAAEHGVSFPIVEATDAVNTQQRERFIQKILERLTPASRVAVWGLSFKPKTDDMREAPSIDVIRALIDAGHTVTAYDPVAMERAQPLLPDAVLYATGPMEAAQESDAVVLLTEWDEFRGIDLRALKQTMKGNLLIDGRNVYEPADVQQAELAYVGIGMGTTHQHA
jgi:UDPglucose 6-dehydrogenase